MLFSLRNVQIAVDAVKAAVQSNVKSQHRKHENALTGKKEAPVQTSQYYVDFTLSESLITKTGLVILRTQC